MEELGRILLDLVTALRDLLLLLGSWLLPWLPLFAWVGFWLFAVNWTRLRELMLRGGWIGVVLIGLVAVMVWGTVAPPPRGYHEILGLAVSNYVGKTVYVTILLCIMYLCGAVQLSGALGNCCRFEEESRDAAH